MPTPLKPKYRLLSRIELQSVEKEFILFLASQGIPVDRWQKLVKSEPGKVDELLTKFSDLILDQIYRKCQLIEQVSANGWLFYHFDDENKLINLVGITLAPSSVLDLREMDRSTLLQEIKAGTAKFNLIRTRKKQEDDKAIEVDSIIKRGGFISSDQALFHQLLDLSLD